MTISGLPVLTFMVANARRLESGLSAQFTVTKEGTSIGSSPLVNWRLTDSQGAIHPKHCQVEVLDGAYCLKDMCGQTYVNGAQLPIGTGHLARLRHEDEVTIGPYSLRVLISDSLEEIENYGRLETLISIHGEDLLQAMDIDKEDELIEESTDPDPLHALDELAESKEEDLIATQSYDSDEKATEKISLVPKNETQIKQVEITPAADSEYEMTSSIRLKKVLGFGFSKEALPATKPPQESGLTKQDLSRSTAKNSPSQSLQNSSIALESDSNKISETRGNFMDEQQLERELNQELDRIEEEVGQGFKSNGQSAEPHARANHLITGPVLNGLGVDLSNEDDMESMHLLSQEMGESLQACVRGLLDLHQQVTQGRFGTLNRNLQPIEDNPLRLGMSYEQTIRTLYDADKSMVHLSAPAAIAESLKTIRDHNEAMQFATSDALSQILNAFAPEVMLRRFQYYKRNTESANVSKEEWAWNMYCNYYQELTSNRQHGFEKLFWEIFEQSYDRKLREKQREF